jgi:hypothetical protein
MVWATLWAIFSQAHPVTLAGVFAARSLARTSSDGKKQLLQLQVEALHSVTGRLYEHHKVIQVLFNRPFLKCLIFRLILLT